MELLKNRREVKIFVRQKEDDGPEKAFHNEKEMLQWLGPEGGSEVAFGGCFFFFFLGGGLFICKKKVCVGFLGGLWGEKKGLWYFF